MAGPTQATNWTWSRSPTSRSARWRIWARSPSARPRCSSTKAPRRAANWSVWRTSSRTKTRTCGSATSSPCAGGTGCGSTRRLRPSWKCWRWTTGSRNGSAGRASASRVPRPCTSTDCAVPARSSSPSSTRTMPGPCSTSSPTKKGRPCCGCWSSTSDPPPFGKGCATISPSTPTATRKRPTCGTRWKKPSNSRFGP